MDLMVNRLFFLVYAVVMVAIGYYGYRRSKTADDFSIAGKTFGTGVSVCLFSAGFLSAASIIGFSGVAFNTGWSFLIVYPFGLACGWLLLQLVSLKFRKVPDWNTTPDVFADRFYSRFMRGWMAAFNIGYMFLFVVIGLMGVGVIVSSFLGIPNVWAFLLVGAIFLAYTSLGGMFSVGWTNVVQFVLLTIGIVGAALFGLVRVGGFGELISGLGSFSNDAVAEGALLSPTMNGEIGVAYIFGTGLGLALVVAVTTYYHRMFFAAKNDRVAGSFVGFSAPLLVVLYLCIGVIGWSARVLLPEATEQQQAFPMLVELMPTFLGALVLAAVASAVMSSIDNQLLAAGVMASRDIYQRLLRPDATPAQVARVSRLSTLAIGVGAILLTIAQIGLIIQIYNFFVIISATTLFVPLALALYWRRTTKEAGIVGTILGFGGGLLWWFFGPASIPATIPMVPLVLVVMVVVTRMTSPPPDEVVERFFGEAATEPEAV